MYFFRLIGILRCLWSIWSCSNLLECSFQYSFIIFEGNIHNCSKDSTYTDFKAPLEDKLIILKMVIPNKVFKKLFTLKEMICTLKWAARYVDSYDRYYVDIWDRRLQCDQIVRILKVFGNKNSNKVAQMIGNFWAILKNLTLM